MPNKFPSIVPPSGIIQAGALAASVHFTPIPEEPADKELYKSYLGTPVYSSLIFKALSGKDLDNLAPDVQNIVSNPFEMVQILMTVDQSKHIVKTALNGRPGTVKEYISDGDYMIKVGGLVVGQHPLQYPETEVKALTTFLQLKQSLEIASSFLSAYGITNVVVSEFKFFQIQGTRNQVEFTFNLLSDTEFKIEPTNVRKK